MVRNRHTLPASQQQFQLTKRSQKGFFSVKNFNISQDEIDQQYALAHEFYAMPLEEKLKYYDLGAIEKGEYTGYEPAGHRM
jgi:isopenicillin N synthase-like dioxygenase